ncbi:histidine phosphatase family protein [Alkaliphilus peptidifermentans]|uniref:Probable phosphoglycerate mutase n=1 Tax=Alkaliphilus peptidifermentans DSM 18978 TaxID=1120976 RepID=A0A1G5LD62_9FIRM|nr:histidine phosphatase family protein [Alkaliphilus peptidifermentans]SCZ10812.1 probable phosphoglycerate mutase [Alkaliphilus peptidifermentans DSM 18978]
MGKIIIVQHCQSEHHINNLSGGWTDTPLTYYGRKQANLVGERLKKEINVDEFTLFSSDLMRANQTAEIIGSHLKLNVIEEAGLREINTGIAAGKTKEWVRENENPRLNEGFDIDHLAFAEGETNRQFYKRVCECMEKIYSSEKSNLLIVTHGGTLSKIVAWWLKLTPEMINEACFLGSSGNISILSKSRYGQNALHLFNDTSHLLELTKG